MADIVNRDEALKCLAIAKAALGQGDRAKAERFGQKALKLYRCLQVQQGCRGCFLPTGHTGGERGKAGKVAT